MTNTPTRRQDEKRRFFLTTLEDWAGDTGFSVTKLSGGWVVLLTRDDLVLPVMSYDIGLNPSSVHRIVNDKVATFDVLTAAGVPAVEHRLMLSDAMSQRMGDPDPEATRLAAFEAAGRDAVLKPLDQAQGLDVVRVTTPEDLVARVADLGLRYPRFCISPFVQIVREDRFYFLDETCLLSYGKRAGVAGLANLAQGGEVIWHDGGEVEASDLAARARRALALRYGCIDVVTLDDGTQLVLEANSGVMLDEITRAAASAGVDLPLAATYRAGFEALLAEHQR